MNNSSHSTTKYLSCEPICTEELLHLVSKGSFPKEISDIIHKDCLGLLPEVTHEEVLNQLNTYFNSNSFPVPNTKRIKN